MNSGYFCTIICLIFYFSNHFFYNYVIFPTVFWLFLRFFHLFLYFQLRRIFCEHLLINVRTQKKIIRILPFLQIIFLYNLYSILFFLLHLRFLRQKQTQKQRYHEHSCHRISIKYISYRTWKCCKEVPGCLCQTNSDTK